MKFCDGFSTMISTGKCVIARDTRPTGMMISNIVSATLLERGIDVYDLGMVPTPVAFKEAKKIGAGIIITSSHNPLEWNGLKFIIDGSITVSGEKVKPSWILSEGEELKAYIKPKKELKLV